MIRLCVLLTLPTLSFAGFTDVETQVLMSLVDYFEPAFLELLEEAEDGLVAEPSFPARHWTLTSVLTVSQLMDQLTIAERSLHGRVSLVALKQESAAWSELKKEANERNMRSAKWVLFSSMPFASETFKDIYVPFDCEFISVNQGGTFPLMTEVYKVSRDGKVMSTHFGYWTAKEGLSYPKTYFYRRRPTFHNEEFTAVIKNSPPYTYVTRDANGNVTFGGYFYEVWKELEFRLKFKTEFKVVDDGDKRPIDLISSGEYQFAVSPVTFDAKTAKIVGLSEPIYEAKVYLFGNRPGSDLEWNSYLKPFSTETWLATLGWMLCSSLAMAFLYRVAWMYKVSEYEDDNYTFTFPVSLNIVFRAMCAQGSDITPKSNACRLLFLSVYMTALVLTSAFSAALFSLLTIPVSKSPFNSYEEVFTASKGYKIGIIHDSDIHHGIKDMAERFPRSDYSKMVQMIEPPTMVPERVAGALERVCMLKNYIFMWDLPNVLEGMQELNRTCQEKVMPGGPMVFKEHIGFGMRKNNPHRELIDLHLVQIKNEGVLRRLLLNTWPPHIPNVANTWVRVTLADISPILYMFTIGVCAGCIILMLERLRWGLRGGVHGVASQASQLMESLRVPSHPLSPISPKTEHWQTKYTDWENNLHRRPREKLHDY